MKCQSIIYPFLVAAQSVAAATSSHSSATASSAIKSYKPSRPLNCHKDSNEGDIISVVHKFRGGAVDAPKKKKKNTKSSKTKVDTAKKATQQIDTTTTDEGEDDAAKSAINTAMKDSDAANSLGDAIRARAHILRKDKLPFQERTFDSALVSLGLSLGTAGLDVDEDNVIDTNREEEEEEDGRSPTMMAYYQYGHRNSIQQNQQFVQPSTSAVIANYFLKTHGGTHLIQCILSLLASVLGMACLVLPSFPSAAAVVASSTTQTSITSSQLSRRILLSASKYQLLQQTLLLAMAKHASALVGAVIIGAQRIPTLGVRNARRHLEMVALDPVGQYLFYCSILVVWMGWFGGSKSGMDFVSELRRSVVSIQNSASAAMGSSSSGGESGNLEVEAMSKLLDVLSQSSPPWFLSQSRGGAILPIIMLAPILLREVISILWVVSDVLSLAFSTSGGITGKFCQGILSTARSILDTFMCIVISSDQWKNADSFQRQRSLARLVSQTSLLLELIVGIVLFGDGAQAFWGFSFGGSANGGVGGTRLPLKVVVGKLACANLYINFLLSRRKKIHELVGSIRSKK